jgi:hypothetical protein
MASKKRIVDTVAMLAEAQPRKCTPATFEAYARALADLTDAQVDLAGTAALRQTSEFMPSPGQLRALGLTGGIGLDNATDRAWLIFTKAIAVINCGRGPNFKDALINATVRLLGGWCYARQRKDSDFQVWYRKEFYETYKRLMGALPPIDQCRALSGEKPGIVEVPCRYEPLLASKPVAEIESERASVKLLTAEIGKI